MSEIQQYVLFITFLESFKDYFPLLDNNFDELDAINNVLLTTNTEQRIYLKGSALPADPSKEVAHLSGEVSGLSRIVFRGFLTIYNFQK